MNRPRGPGSLPAVLVIVVIASCATVRRSPEIEVLLGEFQDPKVRDETVCSLIRRGRYAGAEPRCPVQIPSNGCQVRGVFAGSPESHQGVVVLLNPDWSDPDLPDRPDVGILVIFDAEGRIVPVFEAANYLDSSDAVVRYRSDGALAVVHNFSYAGDPDWSVSALHVVPATSEQRPVLSVLLGPPKSRFARAESPSWKWQARDIDGDGNLEFEIGPTRPDGSLQVQAVYHYSQVAQRYVGPGGSLEGNFYLLPPVVSERTWGLAEAFAKAHSNTPQLCHSHSASGLNFAAYPPGMSCSGPRTLDPSRDEVSLAYHSSSPGRYLTVTVFVYQKQPPASYPAESLAQHLERVRAEVASRYNDFQCEPWAPNEHDRMSGLRCTGSSPEIGDQPLVTFIGLQEIHGWWLKVRATAPATEGDANERDLKSVVEGITQSATR